MRPLDSRSATHLTRRRKRRVVRWEQLPSRSRAREVARRWEWVLWLAGLVVLGFVGWYGWHHHWPVHLRGWLNAGLQIIADPTHLAEVLLGIGIAVVLALWWLPKWQAAGSQGIGVENRFDRENEARKTLAQMLAGVFVLAGLYSSVNTFNLQQQGQITDRFTKAIDQLGAIAPGGGVDSNGRPNPNLEVRLGGIYALERIAHDSPKDQWTIMEVLTAYVRQNTPLKTSVNPAKDRLLRSGTKQQVQAESTKEPTTLRIDIRAIFTVIGRRNRHNDPPGRRINLDEVNLAGKDLRDVNFSGVDFYNANLSRADLNWANLCNAELLGADLRGASLFGTNLVWADLREAKLLGADFETANLSGAQLPPFGAIEAKNLTRSQLANASDKWREDNPAMRACSNSRE